MRFAFVTCAFIAFVVPASAQYQPNTRAYESYGRANPNYHYVQPHQRQDGSTVSGHYRTNPDRDPYNNYNTRSDRFGAPTNRRGLY